jgi:tetratricopeptide (TPR) repeat protein
LIRRFKKWHRKEQATSFLLKAVKQEQAGNFQEAETIYSQLTSTHPEFIPGWTTFGIFLFNQGRIQAAMDLMCDAAERLKFSAEPLNQLGNFLLSERRYEEALEVYRAAADRDPKNVTSWSSVINTLRILHRTNGIGLAFRSILSIRPQDPLWLERYGDYLWELKMYSDAENAFKGAIQSNPKFYQAWVKLGVNLFNQEKYQESLQVFQTAIGIEPQTEYAYKLLGALLEKKGLVDSS